MAGSRKRWSVQGDGWSLAWDRGYLVGEPRFLPELVRAVGLLAAGSGQRMSDGSPVDLGDPRIALDLSLDVLARHGLDTAAEVAMDLTEDTVREKPKPVPVRKTHCPQGHPYDDANTYVHPSNGARCCRTCRARGAVEAKQRKRALSDA